MSNHAGHSHGPSLNPGGSGEPSDRVRVERDGEIAIVTLSRADKHNGIDWPMIKGILNAAAWIEKQRDVRAVVLHGDGPSFCAGLDFKAVMKDTARMVYGVAQLWSPLPNDFQMVSLVWRNLGVPVVAAIHGNCFGGGFQIALGADFRFATPDAKFSIMESKWGLVPDMGGTVTLRELVPIDVAKELAMTGRIFSGTEAKAYGLVTRLVESPFEEAKTFARELTTRSPDALCATKALFHEAWSSTEKEALSSEREWQRKIIGKKNQRTAMKRNLDKKEIPYSPRRVRP